MKYFKKRIITILVVGFLMQSSFLSLHAQTLTIRHFGLADGDATLIVINDLKKINPLFQNNTFTILIDSDRDYCYPQLISGVMDVLASFNYFNLDRVVVSHMHIDHYGSMVNLFQAMLGKVSIGAVIDRFHLKTPNLDLSGDGIDLCYDYIDAPNLSQSAQAYVNYVNQQSALNTFEWTSVQASGNLLPAAFSPFITMNCVATNGVTLNPDGSNNIFLPPSKTVPNYYKPKSQNDLSYCFVLKFGSFNYFTGGDMGGDASKYVDGETPIAQYLSATQPAGYHFCAFKVDHHGSASSSNTTFLSLMNPTLAIVSAALRSYSGTQLPTQAAISRIAAVGSNILYTLIPNNPQSNVDSWTLKELQDVVITLNDIPKPGQNIQMGITTYSRNASTRDLTGAYWQGSITCTKPHF